MRWSRTYTTDANLENDWQPNHFVFLIAERLIRVKPNETQPVRRKCDITNFFTKIPSSKSTEKKAEVTQEPPPKRIKKEKKAKKEGQERLKKRRIKWTVIALENLKGLLRIVLVVLSDTVKQLFILSLKMK